MTSTGYKRERNKKHSETCEEPIIYLYRGAHQVQVEKAYLWIISTLEANNLSQVVFFILTNVLTSISERFGPSSEQIDISRRRCHYDLTHSKLANLTKHSRGGYMTNKAEKWPVIG